MHFKIGSKVMTRNMRLVFILCFVLLNGVSSYDLCDADENLCPKEVLPIGLNCKIKSSSFDVRECSQINFAANEKDETNLGELHVNTYVDQYSQINLNISLNEVAFKKAYLRISKYTEPNNKPVACKMYTTGTSIPVPVKTVLYDACLKKNLTEGQNYLLEYKAEENKVLFYRKYLFRAPIRQYFIDTISLHKRQIFSYIDTTSSYRLTVKIQPLPEFYNVTHYQVEVFREKDAKVTNGDMRLIVASQEEMSFDHVTYNEEGYYYFKISALSRICPEDYCEKTVTPKVYVHRKGTPLVIGIVGASCIIPFVLFLFHMLTRKYKTNENIAESQDKLLIIYKENSNKENDVVKSFVKTIETLTGVEVWLDPVNLMRVKEKDEKWCSDNLLLATHIAYICSSDVFQVDFMTYNFLQEETKKTIPDKDIFVVMMPYSSKKDLPSFLTSCVTFHFMEEFSKFVGVFRSNVSYESDASYLDFINKVEAACGELDDMKRQLDLPTIVITEQSDGSEADPKEKDVLL